MVGMNTKIALLVAAEDAVRARGYDGFSYADLAAMVGIRKASVHHHYATKADLVLALIERYSAELFTTLDRIAQTEATGGARLRAFVGAYRAALAGGDRVCLCVALCIGREGLSTEILARLDMFHSTITAWLEDGFAIGKNDGTIVDVGDCHAEAAGCLAQMEGAQLIARAAKDVRRFDAATERLLARLRD